MTSEPAGTWEAAVLALRERPGQGQLVLDAYYDDPVDAAARRYHAGDEWLDVRAWLGETRGAALDVGAGRGIASYALAREGFTVTALEPDPSPVVGGGAIAALARLSGADITVLQATAEEIPAPDSSFDLVFARAALHHTRDLDQACREFHRVLRPGGRLLALREHVISRPEDLERFFDAHPLHRDYGGENAFPLTVYVDAIRGAGFEVATIRQPLESPMNFAPHTDGEVRDLIAGRAGPLRGLVRAAFGLPGLWPALLPLFSAMDHRPGRLYSFLALKPALTPG